MEKKHSGLGVSSFIIGTAIGILMFLLFIVAGVMETSTPGGIDENSTAAVVIGLFLIAFVVLDLLAIGLGVAGLLQKNSKKLFSVLGLIFSSLTALSAILITIIGLMV